MPPGTGRRNGASWAHPFRNVVNHSTLDATFTHYRRWIHVQFRAHSDEAASMCGFVHMAYHFRPALAKRSALGVTLPSRALASISATLGATPSASRWS